ncbi:MAG: NAD(P)-dependent alcohol dehydrogenase [Chloroflexota bacterium]
MKAIERSRYGPPDVLRIVDVAMPEPADDQLLVRVLAASLNAVDLDYLYGRPRFARLFYGMGRPRVARLGVDVAGRVEAIGPKVTSFQPGDEVYGDLSAYGLGGFAEYVCARARAFAPKPPTLTMDEAAAIPQAAILALQGLRRGESIRPGDKVLINGASGNVGPFAVQIAKAVGAEVTGVCRAEKMDFVRSLGADHVIDYGVADVTRGRERYDWILDVVGRKSIFAWRHALRPGGVYVSLGGATAPMLQALALGPLISRFGSRKAGLMWWWKPFRREDVALLEQLIADGKIAPIIDRRYPLDEVREGLAYLDAGLARGKVVITA